MQYLATMIMGDTSFKLELTNLNDNTYAVVYKQAQTLAGKLGCELYALDTVDGQKPQGYQFTAHDEEFIHLTTQLEGGSERATDHYLREQISIWHNDKPQATQTDFHTLYSLWLKALDLKPIPEIIVHVNNGVLNAVYSTVEGVKCTAVQTDSDDVVEEVQASDAILSQAKTMWSIF